MKTEKNIALEFDSFSKNYTNDMIGLVPHYLKLLSCFTNDLPSNFNAINILDLGCGNGNVSSQLLKLFPKANFSLVDASEDMINLCRSRFKGYNFKYFNTYFNDFSFAENTYDLIVAGFSLHHCDEKEKQLLFKKIYSALKKNGIFSCCDLMINKTSPYHSKLLKEWELFVKSNFTDDKKWNWVMEHYKNFDKPTDFETQEKWLKTIGFKEVKYPFKKDYWIHLQAIK